MGGQCKKATRKYPLRLMVELAFHEDKGNIHAPG